ncbi:hypothetical protein Lal_00025762 [Lupinus albus]|nr:hypothetical protein Lal_00025762 [Lupinus albus]
MSHAETLTKQSWKCSLSREAAIRGQSQEVIESFEYYLLAPIQSTQKKNDYDVHNNTEASYGVR